MIALRPRTNAADHTAMRQLLLAHTAKNDNGCTILAQPAQRFWQTVAMAWRSSCTNSLAPASLIAIAPGTQHCKNKRTVARATVRCCTQIRAV